jgi:glyoxylase I family protein
MPVEVGGIDHIYIAVSDLARAIAFYDPVMRALGFRKGTKAIAGDPHAHYFNRETQYTIRPAKRPAPHDSYAPGLHHLCFQVPANADVDLAVRELRALGVEATEPAFYPEYSPDYYATFFSDPDGVRLEIVAMRRHRALIRAHWHELTEFEDPLQKAGLMDPGPAKPPGR